MGRTRFFVSRDDGTRIDDLVDVKQESIRYFRRLLSETSLNRLVNLNAPHDLGKCLLIYLCCILKELINVTITAF